MDWSCDQSLVTLATLVTQFYTDLTRKSAFFDGWSWFKFNNLGLALGTNLKFYTNLSNVSKLKVRKFWGLIFTFVEVTGEKLAGGACLPTILNRVKNELLALAYFKFFGDAIHTFVFRRRLYLRFKNTATKTTEN